MRDISLTTDGNALLQKMQIQYLTVSLIAEAETAQDNIPSDGTHPMS